MQISLVTAGILGLLLILLGVRVSAVRRSAGVSMGDGGNALLLERMRAQANFAEHAPLGLLLIFLMEQTYGSGPFTLALAIALVAGRILHPIGMARPAPNAPRVGGMVLTWTPIGIAAIALLVAGLTR
ncbi:MAG: MAPEG family protein [Sphingomonadaceae bacterium]